MIKYEIKKVFSRKVNKIAAVLIVIVLAWVTYNALNEIMYVNSKGETERGYSAIQQLKNAKKKWEGVVDNKLLTSVIRENTRIENLDVSKAENNGLSDESYSMEQGYEDIADMINYGFGGVLSYDYFTINSISEQQVVNLYDNRVNNMKTWLNNAAADEYNQKEKNYLVNQYKSLNTPLKYEYADGWHQIIDYSSEIIMIMALIIGFIVSGIFSNETQLKADSIFFSSYYGRSKAVISKIMAGVIIVSVIYWSIILLYAGIILAVCGADGASCAIQTSLTGWKSLYNITYL